MARSNGDGAAKGSKSNSDALPDHPFLFKSVDSQVPGSASYLLSSSSEPPDVRNWFSSYEYESPESTGLPNDLVGSYVLEDGLDETSDGLGNFGKQQEITGLGSKESPPGKFPRSGESLGFLGLENLPIPKDEHLNGITVTTNGVNLFGWSKCKNSHKRMRNTSFREQIDGEDLRSVSQVIPTCKRDLEATLPNTNIREHEATVTDDLISSENKENSQGNGSNFPSIWISTRNSQKPLLADGRKSWNADFSLKGNKRYLDVEEQVPVGERNTSADRTYPLPEVVALKTTTTTTTREVPGNWQCPRKSKPAMRPPLKQLRLERWVHRVI